MSTSTIKVTEHLYNVSLQITGTTEFGIGFQDLLSDPSKMPPQGARFDIHIEGKIDGHKLKGTIKGTDYLYMRPDGHSRLHVHTLIKTEDGANIAAFGDGISIPTDNPTTFNLRENVTLLTAAPTYTWVNQLQIWSSGSVDLTTGEIRMSGYSA
jgi:hypothetical protein